MGWKASVIIIRPELPFKGQFIFEALGFKNVVPGDAAPFEVAMYPRDNRIFAARYKGCTLLAGESIAMDFFIGQGSQLEQNLIALTGEGEICAVTLHSSMNMWGYIVVRDGKRIRERFGDADSGTTLDTGEPLEEEKELLSKSTVNTNGQRTFLLDGAQYNEDQVGEKFVLGMFSRYTGTSLDMDDDLLFNVTCDGYFAD
jgi:hypothetical protein